MLKILTDQDAINDAQRLWITRTLETVPEEYQVKLGWQGGETLATVYWHGRLGFWEAHMKETNRWWNPCGLESPSQVVSRQVV